MPTLKQKVKTSINSALKVINLRVGNYNYVSSSIEKAAAFDRIPGYLDLLSEFSDQVIRQMLPYIKDARSQFGQELFVLANTGLKRDGYFVEFGATNGV